MPAHRATCQMQPQPASSTNGLGAAPGVDDDKPIDVESDQEVTKLVTTPDIQCYEDMEGPEMAGNGSPSKSASPLPPLPQTNLHSQLTNSLKRGRKKQLHPQQVLTPERIKEVVTNNLIQCGLCDVVIPASDETKHLQVRYLIHLLLLVSVR